MADRKDDPPQESLCVKEVQLDLPNIDFKFDELISWITNSNQNPKDERPARYFGHVIGLEGNHKKYKEHGRWFLEVDGKRSLKRNYNGATEYKDFEDEPLSRGHPKLINSVRLICERSIQAVRKALREATPEEECADNGLWQCNINLYRKNGSKAPLSWHQDDIDSTGPTFLPISATYILVRTSPPTTIDAGLKVKFPKGDFKQGSPSLFVDDNTESVSLENKPLDKNKYFEKSYNKNACPRTLTILMGSAYTHGKHSFDKSCLDTLGERVSINFRLVKPTVWKDLVHDHPTTAL